MVLADATSLDIPIWLGALSVGALVSAFAWAGNRAVKANDDKLIELDARLKREADARHDLAGLVQNRHDEVMEALHHLEIVVIKAQNPRGAK